jgi:putative flippase GtrA
MHIDEVLLSQIIKFAVVGFTSFVMDMSITYVCKEKLLLNKYLANTIGFLFAATYNFTLNKLWSFDSHDGEIVRQALIFTASMTTGLLIASGLIYIFSDRMKLNFYISKLLAVSVVMVWNFTMNRLVIFAH